MRRRTLRARRARRARRYGGSSPSLLPMPSRRGLRDTLEDATAWRALGFTACVVLASACVSVARNRPLEIEIRPAAPAVGPPVTLSSITDERRFEAAGAVLFGAPSGPVVPRGENPDDESVTSQWITIADPLPEGRPVQDIVREILTRAFTDAGFHVARPGDSQYDAATPIQTAIERFWCWAGGSGVVGSLDFEARLRLQAELPTLRDGREVEAQWRRGTARAASPDAKEVVIGEGVDKLIENLRLVLEESRVAMGQGSATPQSGSGAEFPSSRQ